MTAITLDKPKKHSRLFGPSPISFISLLAFFFVLAAPAPTLLVAQQDERPRARIFQKRKKKRTKRAELGAITRGRKELAKEGTVAPDFALPLLIGSKPPREVSLNETGQVRLSSFRGVKPVVLIFGSYT